MELQLQATGISLLGATQLTILCAFVCGVGYVDAKIKETLLHKVAWSLTYLPLWKKCN